RDKRLLREMKRHRLCVKDVENFLSKKLEYNIRPSIEMKEDGRFFSVGFRCANDVPINSSDCAVRTTVLSRNKCWKTKSYYQVF
ncbi:MAG: hypothetical protein SVR94_10025, partial [Pseudomonadota bacterium]|nr:hypothetical protein [Pseudomonadota bacterium]